MSPTTYPHMPTTTLASRESHANGQDEINWSRTEMRTRPISPHPVPQETPSTTPVGMATPIAPDLIWPSHPDICHAWQRRPPFPVNLRDLASLQLKGMQAKYSGRCTLLEYSLLDWYGPFGSSLPSCW